MSDIVKRLVALANSLGGTEEDDIMAGLAEIERLRERNASLEAALEEIRVCVAHYTARLEGK